MASYFSGHAALSLVVTIGEKQIRRSDGVMIVVPETINVRFGIQGGHAPNQFNTDDEVLIKALDASPFNVANKSKAQGLFWRVDKQDQVSVMEKNKAHLEQDLVIARAKQLGISQRTPELDINELRAQVKANLPEKAVEQPKAFPSSDAPKDVPAVQEVQEPVKRRGRPKAEKV